MAHGVQPAHRRHSRYMTSVAVHEFGHAAGFFQTTGRHWDGVNGFEPALCDPRDTNRHTMCRQVVLGTTWARDLALHDRHTFDSRYF